MAISSGSPIGGSDIRALANLRNTASTDPKAAVKEAAKQFEGIFMQQLMKSMREASMSSGMLDNAGTKMGTEMLDAQFATQMTGLKGGLSEVIAKQLERQLGEPLANMAADAAAALAQQPAVKDTKHTAVPLNSLSGKDRQIGFLKLHDGAAKAAEAVTGIPANFMVAQAAHESGWGRHEIKNTDGSTSFNVFGIKAGSSWKGATTEVTTTEVINGESRKVKAK
ncbi:MAG: glucosaminidase domain-containing protein, partial [Cytophagales bacterium]|nr:glucosaminidase domain-containing protein [Rhizobacter sp.]